MKKLILYEPAMCCSTGVCGPSIDKDLIRVTSVIKELKKVEGVQAVRYNLSNNPNSFVRNSKVSEMLQEKGMEVLPITVVNDEIVKTNSYPSNKEIESYLDVPIGTSVSN
ncbi:arsenite efflux transporter metallochaperone ArsD [Desemzia sp. C1]|uniref:Arsenical resistance operon trans-acting repressor ArsD n=1 Tax=Marinilactibacillus piezotolerans TaxID=258723 RepID=A0A1I3WW48_9LACT|nr:MULTISPECIES: arsenite efflux transporter metallochaperone ArsD [Carnobacteriaceae]API89756.1 transcriptional regulator [Marinilactibacillus sp. 15R]MCI3028317.1 arsenite efflux transporter metallochaperone ArsD [Desemzia sp. C1]SFK11533.1 Arsenical resistance operon trans-acting repressor ArsD [Marinilactibacillus piezotolerans]